MITPVRKPGKSHKNADRAKKPYDNLEARLQSLKLKRHGSKSRLIHMHETPRHTGSPVPTVTRGFSTSSFGSDLHLAYPRSRAKLNTETTFEVSPSAHCVSMVMESLAPRSTIMKTLIRFVWTCVVASMVTGWWRGVWLLLDSYPVVDGANWQNAVFSLLLGLGLVAVCFASRQALVRHFIEGAQEKKILDDLVASTPATRRLSLLGKALDWIFSIVLAFAVVAQMRGAWYLCDLYILPNDVEASAWITLSVAFVVLTLSSSFKCVVTDVFAGGISTIGPFFSATGVAATTNNGTGVATPYTRDSELDTSDFYNYNQKTGTYTRERVTPVKKNLDGSFSSSDSQCNYSDSGGASESDPEMRAHLEARAYARDGKLARPVPTSGRDKRLSFAEFMGIDERSIDSRSGAGSGRSEKTVAKNAQTNRKSAFSLFSPNSKKPQSKVRSMGLASSECTPTRSNALLHHNKDNEVSPEKLSEIELATPQKDNFNDMEEFHAGDTPGSAGMVKYHSRITATST